MATLKKKRGWFSRLTFGSVSLALAGLLLLSYASLLVNPARAWFFTIFGLLFFPLLITTALFFLWALLRRSRMAFLLALMLLPALLLFGRYYQFRGPDPDETPAPSLKVVSYNVGRFIHADADIPLLALADSVATYLRGQDADVICLQEFYLPLSQEIAPWLRRHFPGYQAEYYALTGKNGRFGNVTLSRLPIVSKGKLTFDKSTNMAFYTDIRLRKSTLRFYNCHFESYNISIPALLKRIGKEEDVMEDTGRRMRRSITQRPQQVETVMRDIDACPVRSMVLGDFNDTPVSYTYQRLRRGHSDAFVKAGKGFGATYRLLLPLLRIDYMLYPKDLEAVSYETGPVRYSDHYPVIATYTE